QISQGNSRDLPAYACRIYVVAFRASIGLWQSLLPHPATPPLSASCSSGQHFASGFLQIRSRPRHPCLWLTLPLAGCVEDFHLQVVQSTTTVNRTAPVTALRAMPGAQRRRRPMGRPLGELAAQFSSAGRWLPIGIRLVLASSGTMRSSSTCSRPLTRLAPLTSIWSARRKDSLNARWAMP
ncbi:hypothetical protein SAMN05216280_10411, partial [Ectopseudomonas oleovorans]